MNKEDCEVSSNCMKSYDCDWCKDYNEYSTINRNILSPAQKKKSEKKKAERKIKKLSSASKRGKANRRNGRAAEKQIEDLLNDLGLKAKRTPMSGALKAGNLIYGLQSKISGDIRIDYKGNNLIVECKRNIHADSWWKLLDGGVIHIKGFCYGLRKELFEQLVNGVEIHTNKVVEDKRFKMLHKYFEQDDSDLVVVTKPYHDPLFFLKEKTYKLFGGKK